MPLSGAPLPSLNRRNLLALAALGGGSAVLAGCGAGDDPLAAASSGSSGTSTVIVGSANFAESELLAEMYCQVLEAKKVTVQRKFDIGARERYIPALQDGSLDLMPEYNGALLAYLLKGDAPDGVSNPQQVYDALQSVLPDGTQTLTQAAAEDKDTVTVTEATAAKYSLTSIGDLKPVAGNLVCGGAPEFQERRQGLVGLRDVYGVQFKSFTPLDVGGPLTIQALTDGSIDAGDVLSTDSALTTKGLVSLQDPENLFLAQNVLPIIRTSKATTAVTEALNAFSATLTTQNLTEYLAKVTVDKQSSAEVATAYLKAVGLT